jgi:multiple sugar transport system permease protein
MTSAPSLREPSRNSRLATRDSYQSMAGLRRREALTAYLFIAPTMLGFLIFIAGPMVSSLGMSLFEWDIVSRPQFIGLENYAFLAQDPGFRTAFRNTATFAVLVVSLNLVVALSLAVALQRTLPTILRYYYRTAFFLPMVTSMASISIVLGFLFHKELGIINYYLGLLGIPPAPWLTSTSWALFTIVLATVWKSFGFDLILFIAGIQNIPRHLYEAAEIDGANGWHQFWRITLPLLSPTIFFAVVVGLISSFQVFDQAFIMTRGGPGDATRTLVMVIYEDAFATLRMGYGSAIAVVLFLVILSLTIFQFRVSSRWVHYG